LPTLVQALFCPTSTSALKHIFFEEQKSATAQYFAGATEFVATKN
jgi:hypothetical protein